MRARSSAWRSHARAGLASALLLWAGGGHVEAQVVKVGPGSSLSPPTLESVTPYVALERGLFKKYGLDADMVAFRGGATNMKALLAGEVDVALDMGATDAMVAASKGARIRVWMVPQPILPYHFVARREAGTTLQALLGKNVAVSRVGAISYHTPRVILERGGIDPDQVKYVAVGSPADRFRALLAGKVDATMVNSLEAAKLGKHPEIVDLVSVPKVLPEIPYQVSTAREEYLERNAETILRMTKALVEANRWIAANKAGTVAILAKIAKDEPAEVLARSYDLADPRLWGVNGDIREDGYKFTSAFLLRVGSVKDPVPFDRYFDRRFVDEALKELGRM